MLNDVNTTRLYIQHGYCNNQRRACISFYNFSIGFVFGLRSNIQVCVIIFIIGFLHTSEASGLY